MFRFNRKRRRCGVQFLDRQIKLVVAGGTAYGRIIRCRSIPLNEGIIKEGKIADEDRLAKELARHVDLMSLRGETAVLTVPTSTIALRKATFPLVKDHELRNLIDVELHGGETQLPFRNPAFDFIRSRVGSEDQDVLIIATPAGVVEQYVRVVKKAGLTPAAVDASPLALFRLLLRGLGASGLELPRRFLLLDVEPERTEISIFSGGYPVFFRTVAMQAPLLASGEDRSAVYARQLSVELGRVMNYYKYNAADGGEEIRDLILSGDPVLCGLLSRTMESDFDRILQMPMDRALSNFEPSHKSFAVPIGLAMKGA